jgi:hypothetical protein
MIAAGVNAKALSRWMGHAAGQIGVQQRRGCWRAEPQPEPESAPDCSADCSAAGVAN